MIGNGDLGNARWRKSTKSENSGGNCVSIALIGNLGAIRNTNTPDGGVVIVPRRELEAFIRAAKTGEYDL